MQVTLNDDERNEIMEKLLDLADEILKKILDDDEQNEVKRKESFKIIIIKKKIILILLIIFIIGIIISNIDIPTKIQRIIYKKEYTEYVTKYSKEYNIDEALIYAVIKAESNFDPNAKSSKNAIGLMQLMETTAKDIIKRVDIEILDEKLQDELQNADININLGTKYLSMLLERYKNIEIALTAYNAGIGTVDNWIEKGVIKADGSNVENIPYKETNNYVRKILRDYKIYKSI